MVQHQTSDRLEKIEIARFFDLDSDRFQLRYVPPPLAKVCRKLSQRGPHGTYIESVGGPDVLAELALYGVPVTLTALPKFGTNAKKCWVVPHCRFRFDEDREAAAH